MKLVAITPDLIPDVSRFLEPFAHHAEDRLRWYFANPHNQLGHIGACLMDCGKVVGTHLTIPQRFGGQLGCASACFFAPSAGAAAGALFTAYLREGDFHFSNSCNSLSARFWARIGHAIPGSDRQRKVRLSYPLIGGVCRRTHLLAVESTDWDLVAAITERDAAYCAWRFSRLRNFLLLSGSHIVGWFSLKVRPHGAYLADLRSDLPQVMAAVRHAATPFKRLYTPGPDGPGTLQRLVCHASWSTAPVPFTQADGDALHA